MWYKRKNDTVIINVYVQTGTKSTEIVGFFGDALKVRLASPPIDGRANDALLNCIAKLFNVPRRQVELVRGSKSRYKSISITGSTVEPHSIERL